MAGLTSISTVTNKESQRGRRPGKPDTRAVILAVARRRFLEDGYHAVTLRSIAAEADVDLALLSYYFGSKKGLFGAALALRANPAEVLARLLNEGDPGTLPERVLRQVIAVWDAPESGPALLTLLRSTAQDAAVAALVHEALEREIVDRIAERVGGRTGRQRAASFTAVLAGLITTRYLLRLEPMASMSSDDVVRLLSPQLRQALGMPVRRSPAASRPESRRTP
ncbi:TetR family transcriptional regulator [Streptomyces sp. NBC_00996]|uniref:TetR/AcrR family transcriptional regulator n=1 Tax=Streptomyces sp. NBC_00996 TaxID=2903710 RepID=UPI00386D4873|nr:TetR family transcriptional regulator [Streptomyces sp. NBC_00996]